MDLRSATEVGAALVKATGKSARRAGAGCGTAGTAGAFVPGACSARAVVAGGADPLGGAAFCEPEGGREASDAATARTPGSTQHAGVPRKHFTARMKVTDSHRTVAGLSLPAIRHGCKSTCTLTRLAHWSRRARKRSLTTCASARCTRRGWRDRFWCCRRGRRDTGFHVVVCQSARGLAQFRTLE